MSLKAIVGALACLSSVLPSISARGQDAAKPASPAVHVYKFSAVHSAKKIIEGVLTDYADSMVVSSEWARCRADTSAPEQTAVARFKCNDTEEVDGLVLSFERAAPKNATWSGSLKRMPFKVLVVCSSPSAPNCARPGDIPSGPPSRMPPVVTEKLKVSEKK